MESPNGKYCLKFVFDVAVGIYGAGPVYFYLFHRFFFSSLKVKSFFLRYFARSYVTFDGFEFLVI